MAPQCSVARNGSCGMVPPRFVFPILPILTTSRCYRRVLVLGSARSNIGAVKLES